MNEDMDKVLDSLTDFQWQRDMIKRVLALQEETNRINTFVANPYEIAEEPGVEDVAQIVSHK